MLNWLVRNVIGKLAAIPVRRRLRAFARATRQPQRVQETLLAQILEWQADTAFGRDHGFVSIRTLADFRRQVPIAGYDYVQPYIQRVMQGDVNALLARTTIHMFAMTSGTTAARKYIPVTDEYLADYRRGWNLWGLKSFRDHPEVRMRPIVQLSGDWQESFTASGVPCGAVTGLTAQTQLRIVRFIYLVPASVGKLKDPAAKYYLALRLSLPRRAGMVIAANPSTLINLARAGNDEKESLLRDLRDGTLSSRHDIPADIRAAVATRVGKCDPQRVRELEAIVQRTGTLYPKDYWPSQCLLGNWTGGSVGAYLRHYPTYYGSTPVRDIGLIASEGRMTIPITDATPSGVLDIASHFFEFVPEAEIDSPHPTVLSAHELQPGQNYFILLTTKYGLYRYNIHDVVRCTGFVNDTPLVEFLSKGSLFANLTGEKVSEYHVTQAMADVLRHMNMTIDVYSVGPVWHDDQPYYGLYLEEGGLPRETALRLTQALEQRLREVNVEYASKRESQRLGPLRLRVLPPGTWQAWDAARLVRTGGVAEQYKHPCLISDPQFANTMPVVAEA